MNPAFRYDKKHDMAYLKFNDRGIKQSFETEDELFVVDVDDENQIVGIEILSVKRLFKLDEKTPADQIPMVTKNNVKDFLLVSTLQSQISSMCPS